MCMTKLNGYSNGRFKRLTAFDALSCIFDIVLYFIFNITLQVSEIIVYTLLK